MLNVVRVVNPSESAALLGPPRPRLLATTARIQTVLVESGLLTQSDSARADLQMAGRYRSGRLQGLTVMAPFRPSRDLSSLRFRLPLFLMLYCSAVALVLYVVADRVQEARFEQTFESTQLLRATEIQSRTERAAERSELETGQREFGELAVFEELRAAVFVSPENLVVLSSRRDWSGRPLDLAALGLAPDEQTRVAAAMQQARQSGRVVSQFSADRNDLTIVMPAALPLGPGDLRLDRRALILLVHDLSFAKSVNSFRLRQEFGVADARRARGRPRSRRRAALPRDPPDRTSARDDGPLRGRRAGRERADAELRHGPTRSLTCSVTSRPSPRRSTARSPSGGRPSMRCGRARSASGRRCTTRRSAWRSSRPMRDSWK